MVSIFCYNALNRAVKEYGLITPSEILNKTSELVIDTFRRTEDQRNINDGMDIALCSIDFKNKKLQYSGANNPLFLFRDGELIEIKANKRSVGASYLKDSFINHTIDLYTNDCIYTFSDGYADQFGGPNGKKFMLKRFRKLLLSISELSMENQHKKIEAEFYTWKDKTFQVDDVYLIGVKI